MNLRKLINIFEATTPAQGVTGQKIAQTSGGQFVNRADRTNQAKVDAALGPGFKAGSAQANTALAKKFSQPAAATPAQPAPAAPSASLDAAKKAAIGGTTQPVNNQSSGMTAQAQAQKTPDAPAADTRGAAAMASKSAAPAPAAAQGRDPGLVNALGIQGQATNVAGADALTGGTKVAAFGKSDMANQTAAPATAAPAAAAPAPTGGAVAAFGKTAMANQSAAPSIQGSAAGFAPAAAAAAPAPAAPSTQGSAAGFAPAGGAAKPGSFSATGMVGTDFEESIEEELEEEMDDDLKEMMRLSGLPLNEKAASKQQQKFMGMVHAMQKGEKVKGASAELKKAAKGMSKKDAKDFASTKHKGLPKKVTEGVVLEAGSTLEHIVNKFKYETKKFINGEDLDSDLYEALFDYYSDNGEIPYGVAKARDGDPYTWIENRFEDELSMMGYPRTHDELNYRGDRDLTELARLAGLTNEGMLDDVKTAIDKATLPKAMHGEYDRLKSQKAEREFQKSGSAYSDDAGVGYDRIGNPKDMVAIKAKDYLDPKPNRDRDLYAMATGSKSAAAADKVNLPSLNRLKEDELTECGDMDMEQPDSFNVSTNMSSDGTKSVNISAQGDRADALLQMLKMAGMRPHDDHDHSSMREPEVIMIGSDDEIMDEERETEYFNTPDEEYQTVDSIIRQGNDLNREKRQNPVAGFTGDNPLGESTLDADLDAMLESILLREREGTPSDIVKAEEPYKDPKTGKMVTPIKGATNPPPDSEFPPGDKRNMMPPKRK